MYGGPYIKITLAILLNSLMLALALFTHKLFHKHIALIVYQDLSESVWAKGIFSCVTQLRVG